MDRRYRIKVWKDRMAHVYPPKWCWEVWERTNVDKVVGCGTTHSQSQSREAASRVMEGRAELRREMSARTPDRLWA